MRPACLCGWCERSETVKRHLETLAIHAGHEPDRSTGAITPAIHLSTTFERQPDGSYPFGYTYSRAGNPNRDLLERTLATLEGGAAAAAFSSGSAAAAAVLRAADRAGRVLAPREMYHGIRSMMRTTLASEVDLAFVDMTDLKTVEEALVAPTSLLWIESPSNPTLGISDIEAIAARARAVGAKVVCDNTWTPPDLQPVFAYGVDLVLHATTKYLAGHSDVLGGIVVARKPDALFERIRDIQRLEGAVASPFDCWLTLRGLKTLPYRMRGHSYNAGRLAEHLAGHPGVEVVHYPGLVDHPGHGLADKQMRSFGGMLSFQVKGGEAAAGRVAASVKLITRATSLGGVESLIEHRASIEGPDTATPADLLRLSVGLEHPDDLIEDLDQALAAV